MTITEEAMGSHTATCSPPTADFRRSDAQCPMPNAYCPTVSVCIANWNGRDVLRVCLSSLQRAAREVPLEVIVVDNASTDGSAAMVECEFPEVVLIRNRENVGFARANNQAVRAARGRYLFFLNNDTVVPPGALQRLIDYADSHPDIGMIGPRLRDSAGLVQISCRPQPDVTTFLNRLSMVRWTGVVKRRYRRYRRREFDPDTVRTVDVLMGAAILMPRSLFHDVGGWDEGYVFGGEDLDLCWRVRQRRPLVYFPVVEVVHHGRVSTRQQIGRATANIAAGFARYLRKSGNAPAGVWLYKLLVTVDTPVELVVRTGQFLIRALTGRRKRARQTLLLMRGLAYLFFRGLPALWRA
jgi:N-acetylglucosaminyl-diphospho-decaprenol L-rhamnosyltransferase